ncbi:unnamed protein product [Cylicocyclus nassatus]|uniref:SHSP domain-containing protein n=1 Tax=Cylicocyclus nassatus TaxID=53992 RepID=A0AA36DMD2_CYLNA|nr:unnamed protein product [Cylicocyclus nassatus]CAJ0589111.1 unnamed protein product [Cylicocyclus nassatus]
MSLSLWQVPRMMDRLVNDYIHEIDRSIFPYWRNADHSMLHVGNDTQQVIDDDKKFAVSLDVSQFRPEDLKVHIDGRELTVEGKQEHKGEHSFIHRSFIRKWTLPKTVDLDSVRTQLSDKGHLCVQAPKTDAERPNRRNIPIMAAPSKI